MLGEPEKILTSTMNYFNFVLYSILSSHLINHTCAGPNQPPLPPAFPPVRHGSRDSSVKQCRQSDCSNNVPPHCPIGFKRTHCTNGRAQFVPTSIALRPPILYVWSEKVRDIKSTIRTKKCNRAMNQFIQNKSKSLARCTVSLPIPWDPKRIRDGTPMNDGREPLSLLSTRERDMK